jgi:drug/metabolite transporter (DMT)-like permease
MPASANGQQVAIASIDAATSRLRRGRLYAAASAVAWSTTGLVQRGVSADTGTQVAGRSLFALIGISFYVVLIERRRSRAAWQTIGVPGLIAAALIAVASGAFIVALNYTTVADVLLISACAPVIAGALGWLLLGETIAWQSVVAILAAVAGVALMIGGHHGGLVGDAVALVMTFAYALHVVVARHKRNVSLAPAAAIGQAIVLLVALPFVAWTISLSDLGLLAVLGAGSTAIAITLLVLAAGLLPPSELTLILLLEVVLGPIFVWIGYSEQPAALTLIGGAIVLTAVLFQVLSTSARGAYRLRKPSAPASDQQNAREVAHGTRLAAQLPRANQR